MRKKGKKNIELKKIKIIRLNSLTKNRINGGNVDYMGSFKGTDCSGGGCVSIHAWPCIPPDDIGKND